MDNIFSRTTNSIASFLQQLRLERVLVMVLAGFLLLVSTACTAGTSAGTSNVADRNSDAVRADTRSATDSPYKGQAQQQRELYDPVQPRKGGANDYSDDFKQDKGSTKAKADDLINRSKQNLQKRADSPQQFVDNYKSGTPIGERVGNVANDIGKSANELKANLSEGVEKGPRNVKENASQFSKDAPRVVQEAGRKAADAVTNPS